MEPVVTGADVTAAAWAWHHAGYTVLPVKADGSKTPDVPGWRQYQHEQPAERQIEAWFGSRRRPGLGLVPGAVSGGLEMFELEGRCVADGAREKLVPALKAAGVFDVWKRLINGGGYAELTPTGGLHLLYRLTDREVPGNTKVAQRPAREDELTPDEREILRKQPGKVFRRVLAETRGEGGFVVVAPSYGATHGTGLPWVFARNARPGQVPTLTWDERVALFAVVYAVLDEMPEQQPAQPRAPRQRDDNGDRPGDIWAAHTAWADVLTPHGWRHVYSRGDMDYWRRPGKNMGWSARTGGTHDGLYVWTTSSEFPTEVNVSKFRAFAILNHGGNDSAAASELRRLGYAAARPQAKPRRAEPTTTEPEPPARRRLGEGATPFKAGYGFASRFPTDRLPGRMRAYVHDIAERKQVPVDLPALMMLGIISSVAGPRITIRRDQDWRQPTNLYVACALDSASGKSPVVEELRRGLLKAQRKLAEKHARDVEQRIADLNKQVEAELGFAQAASTPLDAREGHKANAKRLSQQIENMVTEPPPAPELLYDGDLSVEALAMAMADNHGAGPVIDDEGTFLRNLGGQYSGKTGNLGLMLVGYDCRYYKPRRVNRATAPIDRAALSRAIAPQPSIIADMKHNQTMNDLGFINRFIVSVPGDLIGERRGRKATWHGDVRADRVDYSGRNWWSDLLLSISEYDVIGGLDEEDCATVDLTYEAFKRHYEYADELEGRIGLDGDLRKVKSWASKEAGRCLRVAAILHLAAGHTTDDEVSESVMDDAIAISRWAIEHFLHAGSVVGLSEGADRIKEFIDGTSEGFATRTAISQMVFKGNLGASQISAYVDELVATGCFVEEKGQSVGGRPPKIVRRVAPDA